MVVVVVREVVVVDGHDHAQDEQEEEDEKTKVNVCNHFVPAGHLVLDGKRREKAGEGREREVKYSTGI